MAELKILTFNTEGLGGIKKQKHVFHYLKSKNFDILYLQDTHFTADQEKRIRNRWEGNCYFSPMLVQCYRCSHIFWKKM